jgi:hypothetical protein
MMEGLVAPSMRTNALPIGKGGKNFFTRAFRAPLGSRGGRACDLESSTYSSTVGGH